MTYEENSNKFNLFYDVIEKLYSKEGRSKSYISRLTGIDRGFLSEAIRDNGFADPETKNHCSPSTMKFLNSNREKILSMINADKTINEIAMFYKISREKISKIINKDDVLKCAEQQRLDRIHENHDEHISTITKNSARNYEFVPIDNEEWKDIIGYNGYQVSNMGRVRRYANRYELFYLLSPQPNKNNGRLYVSVFDDAGNRKNFQLARLVAYAFCEGQSDLNNTVNHIDGDVLNNKASNLEWTSQSDNNKHAYDVLKRQVNKGTKIPYTILYQNKYEFKTIAAFARFLGKSETQTRRYLDDPECHDIQKIQIAS